MLDLLLRHNADAAAGDTDKPSSRMADHGSTELNPLLIPPPYEFRDPEESLAAEALLELLERAPHGRKQANACASLQANNNNVIESDDQLQSTTGQILTSVLTHVGKDDAEKQTDVADNIQVDVAGDMQVDVAGDMQDDPEGVPEWFCARNNIPVVTSQLAENNVFWKVSCGSICC